MNRPTTASTTTATTASAASVDTDPATDPPSPSECCGGAVSRLNQVEAEQLAHRLAAAADPTRLQMLSILAEAPGGEVCACDFVGPVERSQPTVSHHLKVLTEAGLVSGERRGRWIWYRLATEGVDDVLRTLRAAVR